MNDQTKPTTEPIKPVPGKKPKEEKTNSYSDPESKNPPPEESGE